MYVSLCMCDVSACVHTYTYAAHETLSRSWIVFQRKCNFCGQNLIHFQITLPENHKNMRAQHQLFLMLNFWHASMFVAKLCSNGKTITKLQLYYNTQQVMLPEMHAWHHNNTAPSTSSPHFHLFYLLQHHSFWITNTLRLTTSSKMCGARTQHSPQMSTGTLQCLEHFTTTATTV